MIRGAAGINQHESCCEPGTSSEKIPLVFVDFEVSDHMLIIEADTRTHNGSPVPDAWN